ncbi:MAG: large conductance mechanosensitive channel protein MscL [Clostridiales bacterium]|nr:large conductance mechanosensitive channel protein MscL [Clostridiales bacterium]
MWKEFKTFALKGNVVDMAVGVIIGGAFGAIVTSLVNDIFMPLIGLIFKTNSLTEKYILLKASEGYTEGMTAAEATEAGANILTYGKFISVIINFILIAIILFFVIKGINKLKELGKKEEEAAAPAPRLCPYCKSEIAEDATRCPHCTSELPLIPEA